MWARFSDRMKQAIGTLENLRGVRAQVEQQAGVEQAVLEEKLEADYYCFGRKVIAPSAGPVVSVENGVDDNVPGAMNPGQPMGNHVIIDNDNGEFFFSAHFKKGSVTVRPGDALKAGDLLGLTGNSGNSSEPHVHYHLQDTANLGKSRGLPAFFMDYTADGRPVSRGEPVKGQIIEAK